MGRVLPFIFVSLALVATAVAQSQTKPDQLATVPFSLTVDIKTESLIQPDAP